MARRQFCQDHVRHRRGERVRLRRTQVFQCLVAFVPIFLLKLRCARDTAAGTRLRLMALCQHAQVRLSAALLSGFFFSMFATGLCVPRKSVGTIIIKLYSFSAAYLFKFAAVSSYELV